MRIKLIARARTPYGSKFGIPRQSSLANEIRCKIVFEPEFRTFDALRGIEGFSHLWLVWAFSANPEDKKFRPLVRPPRLGGNETMGVFATRSPFRPNRLGLSCVELESVENDPKYGPVLIVRGADLLDRTPIYDIKPYIKYADCHEDAVCGYVENLESKIVKVVFADTADIEDDLRAKLENVLKYDPRPAYLDDPGRTYGFFFEGRNVLFSVKDGILKVYSANKL